MTDIRPHICVTGASGLVGHALVGALGKSGKFDVLALTRDHFPKAVAGVTYREVGDINSPNLLSAELVNVDTLVHCVARVHVMHDTAENPLDAFREVNVHGSLNLAQQAAEAGIKRFIYISSIKVNGEFTSPGDPFSETDTPSPQDAYGVSKNEAEHGLRQLAAATGMELVVIRPPLVYGPGVKANFANLLRAVKTGWPLPLGAIHNQRSLVALDNLVDFIVTCIAHPKAANQTFLISDGQDLSTAELVRGLAQAACVPARLLPVPVWMLEWTGRVVGKGDAVQRLCGNLQINSSKARNLLNWRPKVSVKEGLRRAVAGTTPS